MRKYVSMYYTCISLRLCIHIYSLSFTDIDECVRGIDGCQHTCNNSAKQKYLGYKKVQGQSEAACKAGATKIFDISRGQEGTLSKILLTP